MSKHDNPALREAFEAALKEHRGFTEYMSFEKEDQVVAKGPKVVTLPQDGSVHLDDVSLFRELVRRNPAIRDIYEEHGGDTVECACDCDENHYSAGDVAFDLLCRMSSEDRARALEGFPVIVEEIDEDI